MSTFEKAKRENLNLRMALVGPAGGGKTYTANTIAKGLVGGGAEKIAVIDAEKGRAKHYADLFDFSICCLEDHSIASYIAALKGAASAGFPLVIVDGLSPAWERCLELHAEITEQSASKNSYFAWKKITPHWNKLVQELLNYPGHIIVTFRAKLGYELQDKNGKQTPVLTGFEPITRSGTEYEFDIVAHLDESHNLTIQKADYSELKGKTIAAPGEAVGKRLGQLLAGATRKEESEGGKNGADV